MRARGRVSLNLLVGYYTRRMGPSSQFTTQMLHIKTLSGCSLLSQSRALSPFSLELSPYVDENNRMPEQEPNIFVNQNFPAKSISSQT